MATLQQSKPSTVEMITIVGDYAAETLRAAADHVENCEKPILDIIVGTTTDGKPVVTIYQGD